MDLGKYKKYWPIPLSIIAGALLNILINTPFLTSFQGADLRTTQPTNIIEYGLNFLLYPLTLLFLIYFAKMFRTKDFQENIVYIISLIFIWGFIEIFITFFGETVPARRFYPFIILFFIFLIAKIKNKYYLITSLILSLLLIIGGSLIYNYYKRSVYQCPRYLWDEVQSLGFEEIEYCYDEEIEINNKTARHVNIGHPGKFGNCERCFSERYYGLYIDGKLVQIYNHIENKRGSNQGLVSLFNRNLELSYFPYKILGKNKNNTIDFYMCSIEKSGPLIPVLANEKNVTVFFENNIWTLKFNNYIVEKFRDFNPPKYRWTRQEYVPGPEIGCVIDGEIRFPNSKVANDGNRFFDLSGVDLYCPDMTPIGNCDSYDQRDIEFNLDLTQAFAWKDMRYSRGKEAERFLDISCTEHKSNRICSYEERDCKNRTVEECYGTEIKCSCTEYSLSDEFKIY